MANERETAASETGGQAGDRFAACLQAWRDEGRGAVPIVMGIVNVTPDSFSDGGRHDSPEQAVAHARRLLDEGATILDVGGESTRPGATIVPADGEAARVLPVVERLGESGAIVSVDTWKPEVARRALAAGAHVVNDVRGLQGEPELARVVAERGAGLVIMHNPGLMGSGSGTEGDPIDAARAFFGRSLDIAARVGIGTDRIVLDPGFGFGKSPSQNFRLMAETDAFADLGLPILIGTSRKSFINKLTGRTIADGLYGTLATNVVCAFLGAAILRVHDVAPHMDAARVAARLRAERTLGRAA